MSVAQGLDKNSQQSLQALHERLQNQGWPSCWDPVSGGKFPAFVMASHLQVLQDRIRISHFHAIVTESVDLVLPVKGKLVYLILLLETI